MPSKYEQLKSMVSAVGGTLPTSKVSQDKQYRYKMSEEEEETPEKILAREQYAFNQNNLHQKELQKHAAMIAEHERKAKEAEDSYYQEEDEKKQGLVTSPSFQNLKNKLRGL